jgi:hypothetical protein
MHQHIYCSTLNALDGIWKQREVHFSVKNLVCDSVYACLLSSYHPPIYILNLRISDRRNWLQVNDWDFTGMQQKQPQVNVLAQPGKETRHTYTECGYKQTKQAYMYSEGTMHPHSKTPKPWTHVPYPSIGRNPMCMSHIYICYSPLIPEPPSSVQWPKVRGLC